jgi:DNA-directed RNA polymerase subunit E"
MTVKDKVCKNCRRFVEGSVCPVCSQSQFSRSWKGIAIINNPNESEVAKVMGITVPGKYAIWVK